MLVDSGENAANLPVILARNYPSGDGYCECLIRGKSQRGVLVRLLAIFESRGIGVLTCCYESTEGTATFGVTLVLELKRNTDSETLTLVEKLMDTKVVTSIEFAPLEGRPFNNFRYPIAILPDKRGVVIQPELLVDGFQSAFQSQKLGISDGGRNYGRSLVDELRRQKISDRGYEVIVEILKATGWGIGKYEEDEKGRVTFTLKDPAFGIESELEGRTEFLVGMIRGMVERIQGYQMELEGSRFDGKTNSLIVKLSRNISSN